MEKDFFDKIFEQVIEEASTIYVENEENKKQDISEAEFSDIHKQKMKNLFKEVRRNENRRKMVKLSKKIAIVIACVMLLSGVLITSVEAWREEVVKFIMKNNDDNYMSIKFGDTRYDESGDLIESGDVKEEEALNNSYITDEIKFLYLPEGFEYYRDVLNSHFSLYVFFHENKYIRLKKESIAQSYVKNSDIEDAITEKIKIGDKDIFKVLKNDSRISYVWYDELYCYDIIGNIEEDEILKFIENIKILKNF